MLEDEINTHLDYAQEYVDFVLRDTADLSANVKEQMKISVASGMLYDVGTASPHELTKYTMFLGAVNLAYSAIEIGCIPGISPAPLRDHMVSVLRSSFDVPHTIEPLDILERVIDGIDKSLNPENSYASRINEVLDMRTWSWKYKEARKHGREEFLKVIKAHNKFLEPKDIKLELKDSNSKTYTSTVILPENIELPWPHRFNFEKENMEYWLNACKELCGHIRPQFFRLKYSLN